MLVKTKVRVTRNKDGVETNEYLDGLVNTDRIQLVLSTDLEGVLILVMSDGKNTLVKDKITRFEGK